MEQDTNGTQQAGAYRYILEPYNGPESRHRCPKCGADHKFVRYIDTATGQYIAEDCGRCDREDSCGYHLKPRDYFSQHPERAGEYTPPKRDKAPALVNEYTPPHPPELYTIPAAKVRALYRVEAEAEAGRLASARRWPYSRLWTDEERGEAIRKSAFATSPGSSTLAGYLYGALGPQRFRKAADLYHLASWQRAAVFWYIDRARRIRTGKAMHYQSNGHRDKDQQPFYLHTRIKGYCPGLPEGWKLRRCLFGEHLITKDPAAPVYLVESEKTAIIAAALTDSPGFWLAAGGKQYLNADSCAGLKGRSVIAYPDLGAFDEWSAGLQDLGARCGFKIVVSDILEQRATEAERAAGLDIADYLLKYQTPTE